MTRTLRHTHPDDAEALHALLTSDHVVRGTMRLPYMPIETTQARLKKNPDRLQIVALTEDRLSGFAELLLNSDVPRAAHSAELNMVAVHEKDCRSGVARSLVEALIGMCDTFLGIRRLHLTVWQDNIGAIALYESLGFEKEGLMRDYVRSENGFSDAVLMARIHRR